MSQHTEQVHGRREGEPTAWRKQADAPGPELRAWQTAGNGGVRRLFAGSLRGISIGILLASFVALTSLLVYELLLLPAKTTFIAAVAEDYRWPLPPNGWSREDIDGLKAGLGDQTLAIRDVPLAEISSAKALSEFASRFAAVARQTRLNGTAIIYISAHGVVDGEGRPCLLLPGADPLDSGSWLRVSDLLAQIKSTQRQASIHWLLVLDANRQGENWNVGLLHDAFADRLSQVVTDAGLPNLAVLNSTSPGEVGWASLHFRGTVFGHFLQLGLAGAADENRDGQVSLQELSRYLKKSVDAWTCKHRAAHQIPALYPSNAVDCTIAWSVNAKDFARLSAPAVRHAVADEASAGAKLAPLWLAHERLEAYHPHHYAPAKWQEVEHNLTWLEQAAMSGKSYRDAYELLLRRMQGHLDNATQLIQPSVRAGSSGVAPIKLSAALSADATLPVDQLNVYSLPLAEYIGTPTTRHAEQFADAELARMFQQYGAAKLWPASEIVRRSIEVQQLGQRLAVPRGDARIAPDERAHAVVRPLLDAADQMRRVAEDAVFLGPKESPDITAQLDRAKQQYEEIGTVESSLAQGYQVRDRAWAELPYLAQWAVGRGDAPSPGDQVAAPLPRSGEGSEISKAASAKWKEKVVALMDAVQRLDRALQKVEQAAAHGAKQDSPATLAAAAAEIARKVADGLDPFHVQLRDAARRLPLAKSTPETLREIAALLAAPLISGTQRADLYARYIEAAEDIDSDTAPGMAASKDGKDANSPTVVGETHADTHWTVHPVAELLRSMESKPSPRSSENLLALGEELRSALRGMGGSSTAESVDASKVPSTFASSELLEMERPLRRLAALQLPTQTDPARRIQRRHLQDLLLWHGQRVLDDFWGSTQPGRQQYFAEVAEAYLADVRLLAHPDVAVERAIQRLNSLLDRRNEAAAHGLATTSTDLVLIDEELTATAKVGIQETAAAVGLPAGTAAVFLRDDNAPIARTLRQYNIGTNTADARDAQKNISITVQGRDLVNRSAALQAVAMFRGHEFPAPMMQRDVAGPSIEVQRQPGGMSHITMRGTRAKKASIVFILDCSHSMSDAVPMEAPDSPERGAQMTKMNVAVEAMQGMMERLGEQGDVRVGVRFFGHRVGWRTDEKGATARQESYPGGVSPTLHPYEDVELFLPLGRFDSVTAGTVNRRLKLLKPWGESPIYLSLMEALKDFSADDKRAEQRVVVITDGMNYQFNPPPEASPGLSEVESAYANHGIGIDIVGFGIPADERATAVKEFTQLTQKTTGSFTQATNASSLIHRLDQLLVKTQFRILDGSGHPVGEADLGGTIAVKPEGSSPQPCAIEVEQLKARTQLRGREALQLAISRDGRKIVSMHYEDENPVFVPLVTAEPTQPSGYHVGLHRRIRETDAVVFPISFQRDDRGIAVPPAQVWVEITPVSQGRRLPTNCYVFFDESFEPDMPVPLIRCRCKNWPKDSDQAEVRVWCIDEPIGPTEVASLAQVANRPPLSGEGFELTNVPGVRYQVRNQDRAKADGLPQIRVVERHKMGVPVNAVKVELTGSPSRIVHQFDWDRGIVLHAFEFGTGPALGGDTMELKFTTRDKFTAGAWRMEQPMMLDIAKHVEVVLPPRLLDPNAVQPGHPAGL